MNILSHKHAFQILKKQITNEVEEFWCLALASNLRLLESKLIFRGTVDYCTIHPRDIFRFACQTNASKLVIAHNHPSNDLNPSKEDIEITNRLLEASHFIEIPIIDHIIVGSNNYLSMAERGYLKNKNLGLHNFTLHYNKLLE